MFRTEHVAAVDSSGVVNRHNSDNRVVKASFGLWRDSVHSPYDNFFVAFPLQRVRDASLLRQECPSADTVAGVVGA